MHEQYVKWHTKYLDREFEMLVFGHAGYPIILFPTSKARYYQNKDFKLIDSVTHLIDQGFVKIYCPDGIDAQSWYNNSIHPADRVKTHMAYEKVIVFDVIDFARRETGWEKVGAAGCSFGGYHAANLAFRHPDVVGYLFSMSGCFDIKQFIMGYYDDNCYFNNPPDYLRGLTEPRYLDHMKQMGIVLGAGQHDICLAENVRLSDILKSKGIPHWLDLRPGGVHDWPLWHVMFPEYLSQIAAVKTR